MLSGGEFTELLSYIRFGLSVGLISGITPEELNSLSVKAQPATLTAASGKVLDQTQRDILRAEIVRKACADIKE